MFGKNVKDDSFELALTAKDEEIARKDARIKDLQKAIEDAKHEKALADLKAEFSNSEKSRKISDLSNGLDEKITAAVSKATLTLKLEKNDYKTKCEILEKAFENMGFDVKDMKGILDKLVDGLISKNEVRIVK